MHWEFWITIIVIASAIVLYPFFRWLIKRTFLLIKLLYICKKNNYKLHKNSVFWFFSGKYSKNCDFYIETKDDIYAIKLFGIKKRLAAMVFLENDKFYIRNYLILPSRGFFTLKFDTKIHDFPIYDFFYGYKGIWHLKKHHSVLLINPSCVDIQCSSKANFYTGDKISGMEIHSLSGFIKQLNR